MPEYGMRISDWSSDVCSSDLQRGGAAVDEETGGRAGHHEAGIEAAAAAESVAAAEKLKLHACSDFRCIGFIGNDNRIRISISISYYKEGLLQGRVEMALPKVVVTNWVPPEVVATLEPHCRVRANPGRAPWPE